MTFFTARNRLLSAALLIALGAGAAPSVHAQSLAPKAAEINALLRLNKIDDAVGRGETWSSAEPQSALAWLWVGRAYARQAMAAGILSKASWASKTRAAYERAVALDGGNLDARFDLMQYYVMAPGFMGGDDKKAQEQAQAILAQNPARGHIALGVIAQSAKDEAAAEREFRQAVALAPTEVRIRAPLAGFLAGKKRWAELRALYAEVLARAPDEGIALYQLGRCAALSGEELHEGLANLDRFIALPARPDELSLGGAHWRRGQILDKLGRKAEALAEVRAAVELEPGLEDAKKDLKRLGG